MMSKGSIRFMTAAALAFVVLLGGATTDDPSLEGFGPLFNGVNMAGWAGAGGHARDWYVEDGQMVIDGRTGGGAGWLRTADMHESFELHFEYELYEGGNSGVALRMQENRALLEVQLLDDYADRHADLQDWQYNGSLYGMVGPSEQVTKQPGQWQSMRIVLDGQQLTVTLNGTLIVEADLDQFADDDDYAGYHAPLQAERGYIGFQNYDRPLRLRNVMIRAIEPDDS